MILQSLLHPAVSLLSSSPVLLPFSPYENRKRVCLENQSPRSQLTDRRLCVCVCVHARIIAFREPLNALPLFLQLFRDLQYLLWALCPKGNILSRVCVTCYLEHAAACGPAHMTVLPTHMQSVSKYLHAHMDSFHLLDIM